MNVIWNGCSQLLLNQLQVLQNRVIKFIERKHRRTSTSTLYKNKLNIKKISQSQTITAIHGIKLGNTKVNFDFQKLQQLQQYNLRNLLNYRAIFVKKTKCKNSIKSDGVRLYNRIDNQLKGIESMKKFKKEIKQFLLQNEI